MATFTKEENLLYQKSKDIQNYLRLAKDAIGFFDTKTCNASQNFSSPQIQRGIDELEALIIKAKGMANRIFP